MILKGLPLWRDASWLARPDFELRGGGYGAVRVVLIVLVGGLIGLTAADGAADPCRRKASACPGYTAVLAYIAAFGVIKVAGYAGMLIAGHPAAQQTGP